MRVLTVSDAHLLDARGPAATDFLAFLSRARTADLVVLNGDIFEFLVGRQRRALAVYGPILEALEELADAVETVYIEGNHDFHLARVLPETVAVRERFELVDAGGCTVWLHGDTVGPDLTYRFLRGALRTPVVRLATEHLPANLVWALATRWAHTSRSLQSPADTAELEARTPAVRRILAAGVDRLITGHLHLPERLLLDQGEWVVLGAWMTGRWYHEIRDGRGRLEQFAV